MARNVLHTFVRLQLGLTWCGPSPDVDCVHGKESEIGSPKTLQLEREKGLYNGSNVLTECSHNTLLKVIVQGQKISVTVACRRVLLPLRNGFNKKKSV